MTDNRRKRMERRRGQLDNERSSFIAHWRDLNEHISPRSARFLTSDRNKGDKRNAKIINNSATLALRAARAGMMGGITSPARPWFQLTTPDPELAELGPVKEWLYEVTTRMRALLLKTNLYNALPTVYGDLLLYGTHALGVVEDEKSLIRFHPFPTGSYMLASNDQNRVDSCYREFSMTPRQMAQRFGKENLSTSVQNMLANGNSEGWIDIVHAIEPNEMFDASKLDSKFKRFASVYYEKTSSEDKCLSEKGFEQFPILAPRWDVTGEDVYGFSPGMETLGDVRALQVMERRKAEAIDKLVRPPMNAPSSMRNRRASILPGDINYIDVNQGQQGFTPAYQIDPRIGELGAEIANVERRVKRGFFEDLFLMVSGYDGQPRTAEEIAALKTEQLLQLGPVLERTNDELLSPIIDITFERMMDAGMLPPPPEELMGMDLKVEYTSIIAQAQKLAGAASVERFASFTGNLAAVRPDALDRLNVDELMDAYAEITGVPPKLLVSLEDANKGRQARAQQQQAAQAMEMGQQAAQGAATLAKADTGTDNALTRIMQGLTGAPAV
jgi:hypothetical protein